MTKKTSKSSRQVKTRRQEPEAQITRRESRIVRVNHTFDWAKIVLALAALVSALAHAFHFIFR